MLKGIRELSPAEFKSGTQFWIIQYCSPFGFRDELWDFLSANLKVMSEHPRKLTLDYGEEIPHALMQAEKEEGR